MNFLFKTRCCTYPGIPKNCFTRLLKFLKNYPEYKMLFFVALLIIRKNPSKKRAEYCCRQI
ncbi:hypothetical protein EFY79_05345 [Hanamia caeni]|uniref:Uncharacterized protein n=1 Tax=Hanamia caeni TaxID=2294116 RepID=A0A3M9NMS3_9BACT|nr:hypothetical protein EFY79_05345 [Hanamia caeni]